MDRRLVCAACGFAFRWTAEAAAAARAQGRGRPDRCLWCRRDPADRGGPRHPGAAGPPRLARRR